MLYCLSCEWFRLWLWFRIIFMTNVTQICITDPAAPWSHEAIAFRTESSTPLTRALLTATPARTLWSAFYNLTPVIVSQLPRQRPWVPGVFVYTTVTKLLNSRKVSATTHSKIDLRHQCEQQQTDQHQAACNPGSQMRTFFL